MRVRTVVACLALLLGCPVGAVELLAPASAGSRLAELPPGVLTALAAGEPQELLVLLDAAAAERGAEEARQAAGLPYDGPRGLEIKAEMYAREKSRLRAGLGPGAPEVLADYSDLPVLFMRFRSLAELEQLANRREVVAIEPDQAIPLASTAAEPAESLSLIRQPQTAEAGKIGTDTVVAVLDTRIESAGMGFPRCAADGAETSCVVAARDFTADRGGPEPEVAHGTHVAGIVLRVAPDTRIAALSVVARDHRIWTHAVCAAIDWSLHQKRTETLNIVALNLSMGAGGYPAPCPERDPVVTAVLAAVRRANVLPVVAAGDSGLAGALAWPACVPGAVSVAAVYDSYSGEKSWCTTKLPDGTCLSRCIDSAPSPDQIACFSNTASFLTLAAPGVEIGAAGITATGTSQAAPFVSGTAAVLRSVFPRESIDQTLSRMTATGIPILVPQPSPPYVVPRLDLWPAWSSPAPERTLAGPSGRGQGLAITCTPMSGGAAEDETHVVPPGGKMNMNARSTRSILCSLAFGVSAAALCHPALAQTFTDDTFANSDWASTKIVDTTSGSAATFTAAQDTANGSPQPPSRRTKHTYLSGLIRVAHLNNNSFYDPVASGALGSLTYSYNLRCLRRAGRRRLHPDPQTEQYLLCGAERHHRCQCLDAVRACKPDCGELPEALWPWAGSTRLLLCRSEDPVWL